MLSVKDRDWFFIDVHFGIKWKELCGLCGGKYADSLLNCCGNEKIHYVLIWGNKWIDIYMVEW